MTNAQSNLGLGSFFLKARPVRSAGLLVALTALLLFASIVFQQALALSGTQVAEQTLGRASGEIAGAGATRLGASTAAADAAILSAVQTNLWENRWGVSPSSASVELRDGRWPSARNETAISPAMANRWPIGSRISFYAGALNLRVVGIARERYNRSAPDVFVTPGTLTSLNVSKVSAARSGVQLQRNVFWSGSPNHAAILAAVNRLVPATYEGVNLYPQLTERAALEAYAPSVGPQTLIASVVAPLLAALVGGVIALRFVARVRTTLWTVGISWRQSRSAALRAVFGITTLGASIGVLAGIGVGILGRLVIAPFWTSELGTLSLVAFVPFVVVFLVVQLVGAAIALLALRRHSSARSALTEARRRRSSRLAPLALAGACAIAGTAVVAAAGGSDVVLMSTGAFLYGLVVLALTPALFAVLRRVKPKSMPILLAVRRITMDARSASLSLIAVTTLVLLGFCTSTFIASSFAAFNKQQAESSPVLPDQLQFAPQTGTSTGDAKARKEFEEAVHLGAPAITQSVTATPKGRNDGVITIATATQFEALTRIHLATPARETLNRGGALLVSGPDASNIAVARTDRQVRDLVAVRVDGVPNTWNRYTAFILSSTAKTLRLKTEQTTFTYNHVSAGQRDQARPAALQLGISPDWVTPWRQPPIGEQGVRTALAGSTLAVLAGLLMLLVAAFEARSLRPSLAGLRAVGVSSSWLSKAVTARSLILAVSAATLALLGAIGGVTLMIKVANRDLVVAPPTTALAMTTGVLIILTLIGAGFAARSLRVTERAL